MAPLKILVDGRLSQEGYKWGKHRGLGHYCLNLLTHLPRVTSPSSLAYMFGAADVDPSILEHRVRLHRPVIPFQRSLNRQLLSDAVRLPGALRSSGCDLVHFLHHLDAPPVSPLPVVVTVPDIIPYLMRRMYSPLRRAKNLAFMRLEKAIIGRAAAIIAISERTKADLVAHLGVDPEKVTVTPLGISQRFLAPLSPDAVTAVRTKFRLPERFLLYVGGIDPRKNIPALIEAMSVLIHQTEWRLPLVLAGRLQGQPEYPGLMRRIRELGLEPFVITPGFVPDDDLPALYAAAVLFVFPSVYEGFGLPVLQSMAAGCPVLAVRASSVPEVAGDAAAYVDTGTAQEMAQAIAHVLREPGRLTAQREKGRIRAAGFSWERTARETLAVYERVAAATNRKFFPDHS